MQRHAKSTYVPLIQGRSQLKLKWYIATPNYRQKFFLKALLEEVNHIHVHGSRENHSTLKQVQRTTNLIVI